MTLEEAAELYKKICWNMFVDKINENSFLKGIFEKVELNKEPQA